LTITCRNNCIYPDFASFHIAPRLCLSIRIVLRHDSENPENHFERCVLFSTEIRNNLTHYTVPPVISCLPVPRKQHLESEDQEVVLNVKPERNYIKQITHCRKPVIAILGSCKFGSALWGNICLNFELRTMQSRAKVSGSHTTGSNNYETSSMAWYSPSK
jgi:hypothetical protein